VLGYSIKFVNEVNNADPEKIGVKLGLLCIDRDIPVTTVANYLNVSRMTIYMWFTGRAIPNKRLHLKNIEEFIGVFASPVEEAASGLIDGDASCAESPIEHEFNLESPYWGKTKCVIGNFDDIDEQNDNSKDFS
jgi:hypothetical protein